jgi:hypothetical protein
MGSHVHTLYQKTSRIHPAFGTDKLQQESVSQELDVGYILLP